MNIVMLNSSRVSGCDCSDSITVTDIMRAKLQNRTTRNRPLNPELKVTITSRYSATGKMQQCSWDDFGITTVWLLKHWVHWPIHSLPIMKPSKTSHETFETFINIQKKCSNISLQRWRAAFIISRGFQAKSKIKHKKN